MGPWPGRPYPQPSLYNPLRFYATSGTWESKFNSAYVDRIEYPQYPAYQWYNANFTSEVPGAKSFWDARQEWEDAMTRVFAAEDDAQFEERFQEMLDIAVQNGLTEEAMKQANEVFEKEAAPYEGNIEKHLETIKNR